MHLEDTYVYIIMGFPKHNLYINVTMKQLLHFGQFVTFWADNDDQKCNNHVTIFVTFWVDRVPIDPKCNNSYILGRLSLSTLSVQNVTKLCFTKSDILAVYNPFCNK